MNTLLLQNNFNEMSGHFSVVLKKRIFSQVILAVFFGQADACIATDYVFETLAELNPQMRNQLKIIAISPPIIHAVTIVRKNIDESLRNNMMNIISNLDQSAEGRQVLMLFKIEQMVPLYESDISTMETILYQYKALKNKNIR